MASIADTLKQKYAGVPLYVWGGGAVLLGSGVIVWRRRGKKGAVNAAPSMRDQYADPGLGGGGGVGGGSPGDKPYTGASGSIGGASAPLYQTPPSTSPPPASAPSSQAQAVPSASSPASFGTFDFGAPNLLLNSFRIQNQPGSALTQALASINPLTGFQGYTPSATDYATEQPGGIMQGVAQLPGTNAAQGQTYSVYGTSTGSGAYVAPNQRIAGERYDSLGRVIL